MRVDVLSMFVVYERPADYPQSFVVRRYEISPGHSGSTSDVRVVASLEEARRPLAEMRLTNIGRYPGDDPVIVEVWL